MGTVRISTEIAAILHTLCVGIPRSLSINICALAMVRVRVTHAAPHGAHPSSYMHDGTPTQQRTICPTRCSSGLGSLTFMSWSVTTSTHAFSHPVVCCWWGCTLIVLCWLTGRMWHLVAPCCTQITLQWDAVSQCHNIPSDVKYLRKD